MRPEDVFNSLDQAARSRTRRERRNTHFSFSRRNGSESRASCSTMRRLVTVWSMSRGNHGRSGKINQRPP